MGGNPSVGWMIGKRLRRWPIIQPTLGQRVIPVCPAGMSADQVVYGRTRTHSNLSKGAPRIYTPALCSSAIRPSSIAQPATTSGLHI